MALLFLLYLSLQLHLLPLDVVNQLLQIAAVVSFYLQCIFQLSHVLSELLLFDSSPALLLCLRLQHCLPHLFILLQKVVLLLL